ncbi:MAG: PEP-CTERM sorting domain-containing protein [Pseudomonadota bacterium]
MTIKLFCAIFLFITSTCVNAVIVDGKFSAVIYYDGSDEGVWSRSLSGSEVTAQFWYDTALAPAPDPNYPHATSYRSETNSWLNLIYFIDGKTIDISQSVGSNFDPFNTVEGVHINAETDYFGVHKEGLAGDILGDYVHTSGSVNIFDTADIIKHNELEQNFSWVSDDSYDDTASFIMTGRSNGQQYTTLLEMYLTELTVATREVSVPAPSPFPLLLIGLAVLVFRRRAYL